ASSRPATTGDLERLVTAASSDAAMDVEATLVAGAWPQLGLAGVVWDGVRAVGIADDPEARAAVGRLAMTGVPVGVRLRARPPILLHGEIGLPIVDLEQGIVGRSGAGANPPAVGPPGKGEPTWARVSGLLERGATGAILTATGTAYPLEVRCQPSPLPAQREVLVIDGIGVADPARVYVGCDGVLRAAVLVDVATRALGEPPQASGPARAAASAAEAGPAGIGAGLVLASGVMGLVICAVAMRRRGRRAVTPGEHPEAVDTDESLGPPTLALVELPRERGSP
ncbi:MAG: hypothetical protein ACRDGJ_06860, partial [Candidatus Limnocylindria bacterium]